VAWQRFLSLVVGFVRAGDGRHKVAINGGDVLRHRAVCRSASACLWRHEAPWQWSVRRSLPWYDYGVLVVAAFASGYDAMKL